MLKTSITVLLFLFLGTFHSFGQKVVNDANAELRPVGSFTGISVASGIDLYLSPGDQETVVVSGYDNKERDKIKTEVVNGVLRIYVDKTVQIQIGWNGERHWKKAYVSYKTLNKLLASGGSDVYGATEAIKSDSFELSISGGSDITLNLETGRLLLRQSGGSDADLRGTAKNADVSISGGSDLNAYALNMENCNMSASGGSDANLSVSAKLVVNASGGSDVSVKGNCEITKNTSGSSEVKRKN